MKSFFLFLSRLFGGSKKVVPAKKSKTVRAKTQKSKAEVKVEEKPAGQTWVDDKPVQVITESVSETGTTSVEVELVEEKSPEDASKE